MKAETCLFCRIVRGETPAFAVYESETVVAFLDRAPLFHGHLLVVPRTHIETLPDLPPSLLPDFFETVQKLAVAVVSAMSADGSFIAINNRVSQSVPHLHVHVVPRKKKDGLRGFFWPRTRYADDDEASRVCSAIRAVSPSGRT